jgi:hypothetical protein
MSLPVKVKIVIDSTLELGLNTVMQAGKQLVTAIIDIFPFLL